MSIHKEVKKITTNTLQKMKVAGDKISMLWVGSGTHKGTYNHIPPTGKRLQVNGTSFLELKDGKIIRATFLWDGADMLRQMGLLPEVQLN